MPTLEQMRKLLSSLEFCKPCKREELKVQEQPPEVPEIERIYYKKNGYSTECKYRSSYKEQVQVSSAFCQVCRFCVAFSLDGKYVDCSYLRDKAHGIDIRAIR
jgi:hypothetical protein